MSTGGIFSMLTSDREEAHPIIRLRSMNEQLTNIINSDDAMQQLIDSEL